MTRGWLTRNRKVADPASTCRETRDDEKWSPRDLFFLTAKGVPSAPRPAWPKRSCQETALVVRCPAANCGCYKVGSPGMGRTHVSAASIPHVHDPSRTMPSAYQKSGSCTGTMFFAAGRGSSSTAAGLGIGWLSHSGQRY